jgi:hypothetical protein
LSILKSCPSVLLKHNFQGEHLIRTFSKKNLNEEFFFINFISMSNKAIQIFQSVLNEADKIEDALLSTGKMPTSEVTDSVSSLVHTALKSLEGAVTILIKNTDTTTNNLNDEVLENINHNEIRQQLQKISLMARRIEREVEVNRKQ